MAEQDHERIEVVVAGVGTGPGADPGGLWWAFLLRGVFALVLGVFALFWPTLSLSILVLVVGVYCIVDGIASLIAAMRVADRRGYVAQSIVALGIGAVLIFWPEGALRVLLMLFGAWILFLGISHVMSARQIPAGHPDRSTVMGIGVFSTIVGAVLILWPGSGVVTISWMIGAAALVVGGLLIYLAMRFRRLNRLVDNRR